MRLVIWILSAYASILPACSQLRVPHTPASPAWPFGPPKTRVRLEGLLTRTDGETVSIELHDQRVIRFRLDEKTRYQPESQPDDLTSFRVADYVEVQSEVDGNGFLRARSVSFLRMPSRDEKAEVFQNPEMMQRWRQNQLQGTAAPSDDDRRLSAIEKPSAIGAAADKPLTGDGFVGLIRRRLDQAFEDLPNLRSTQVTSLFHSTSKPIRWIPEGIISAEIEYEEGSEAYSDIRINGRRPPTAPDTADPEYMRSLDKAWSTGDFESIAHCVFSELTDGDFHKSGSENEKGREIVRYEFNGRRSSGCIGVLHRSEVAYPAYKGMLQADSQTGEILHIEIEATDMPAGFPMDRAERSMTFRKVQVGTTEYLLPATAYWFGCFRNSYSCFLNRIDFRNYRRFESETTVRFDEQ
jgi:hypothetical protein